MNHIQIINSYQDRGILQMMWSGEVNLQTIRASFVELNRILKSQTEKVNLVITVDTTTHIPRSLQLSTLPRLQSHNLRGWMVVGDNRHLNHTVTAIMNHVVSHKGSQTVPK